MQQNDGGIITELKRGEMVAKTPAEKANLQGEQFQSVFTIDIND